MAKIDLNRRTILKFNFLEPEDIKRAIKSSDSQERVVPEIFVKKVFRQVLTLALLHFFARFRRVVKSLAKSSTKRARTKKLQMQAQAASASNTTSLCVDWTKNNTDGQYPSASAEVSSQNDFLFERWVGRGLTCAPQDLMMDTNIPEIDLGFVALVNEETPIMDNPVDIKSADSFAALVSCGEEANITDLLLLSPPGPLTDEKYSPQAAQPSDMMCTQNSVDQITINDFPSNTLDSGYFYDSFDWLDELPSLTRWTLDTSTITDSSMPIRVCDYKKEGLSNIEPGYDSNQEGPFGGLSDLSNLPTVIGQPNELRILNQPENAYLPVLDLEDLAALPDLALSSNDLLLRADQNVEHAAPNMTRLTVCSVANQPDSEHDSTRTEALWKAFDANMYVLNDAERRQIFLKTLEDCTFFRPNTITEMVRLLATSSGLSMCDIWKK